MGSVGLKQKIVALAAILALMLIALAPSTTLAAHKRTNDAPPPNMDSNGIITPGGPCQIVFGRAYVADSYTLTYNDNGKPILTCYRADNPVVGDPPRGSWPGYNCYDETDGIFFADYTIKTDAAGNTTLTCKHPS